MEEQLTFSELRWRVEVLHKKGWKRDSRMKVYEKTLRYHECRARREIPNREVLYLKFNDREDYLDFVDYTDRMLIRQLSNFIAERAYLEGLKWID